MTDYIQIKINLSDGQKDKVRRAIANDEPVSLRLNHNDLDGNDIIAVTRTQLNKMIKAQTEGTGVTLKLSKKQLAYNKTIEGGFIGTLLGLAGVLGPLIAKTAATAAPAIATGALSGLAGAAAKRIVDRKKKGEGLYLKKGGCVCEIITEGDGLYLKKGGGLSAVGDGLYLKSGGKLFNVDIKEAIKKLPLLKVLAPITTASEKLASSLSNLSNRASQAGFAG